jgi:bifunctional DNA-binding transcriptional regulator/antitoxin component of YhaV-PrlF toxin-antitoxin module
MGYTVGPKGQVVIAKEIRDKLGVAPGWVALQRLAGDHAEVHFVPPPHRRSLKGGLTRFTKVRVRPGREWAEAREAAWAAESRGGGYRRANRK